MQDKDFLNCIIHRDDRDEMSELIEMAIYASSNDNVILIFFKEHFHSFFSFFPMYGL